VTVPSPTTHQPTDLARFFTPRTVAVVGASDTAERQATTYWRMLSRWGAEHGATVWPVNPNRDAVDGVPCVADLASVPAPADGLDVVAVLVADPVPTVRSAVALGARFVVVFSAGWAETGPEGAARQHDLATLVTGTSTRLIGPNTNLNAFEAFRTDLPGPSIAIVSQSGHQGRPLFLAQRNGVAVSHWAPTGNEADLDAADFIGWFAHQPGIGAVAAYLEGVADGDRFREAAEACLAATTPLAVVKVGRTDAGARSAASHTGKLTGADVVFDSVCARHGVERVEELDELADVATLLARHPDPPRSDGIAIYSISGGTGAHVADLAVARGGRLATFSATTRARLRDLIPDILQVDNPVDCGGPPVGDERGRPILDTLVADPDVGVLVVVVTGPFPPLSDRLAADVAAVAADAAIPVVVVWGSPVGDEPAYRETLLGSPRLVTVRRVGNALTAISSWHRFHLARASHRERPLPDATGVAPPPVGVLAEPTAKALATAVGVRVTRDVEIGTASEAEGAAEQVGGVAVLKVVDPALPHRSDLGLVVAGVTPDAAAAVAADLFDRARSAGGTASTVLVCEQVAIADGVEMVVGMAVDPTFGPVVTVGAGGVLVELLDDVATLVTPFDAQDVHEALGGLRTAPLLHGHRGSTPLAVDALVDVVLAVQRLALDPAIGLRELDLNPVLVTATDAIALDALAVVAR
jgi:acyl-CoA synthetase (NDP forming)